MAKWHKIIKECTSSEVGIIQWLNDHNISKDQYYYWRRKLKDTCIESIQPSFVEIPLPSNDEQKTIEAKESIPIETSANVSASIRIGAMSIDIKETASTDFIKKLIEAAGYAK